MSIKRFQIVIMGAVLAAAGCAQTPPPAGAPSAPPVVADGSYRATVALTDMAPGFQKLWCDTEPSYSFVVKGNAFSYPMPHPGAPGNPTPVYDIQIKDDGSFRTENEAGVMIGQFDGTAIKAKINGTVCYYEFSAQRN